MRKTLLTLLAIGAITATFAQDNSVKYPYKKRPTIGFHFTLHDFQTAEDLQNTSLARVLDQKNLFKPSRMSSGLAMSYVEGLTNNVDFMARFGLTSLAYPIPNRESSDQGMLWESDANLNFKLFSDNYLVSPFASVGVGASKWKGYYGAYMPLGLGLQVNLGDDGFLMLSSAYRVAVTSGSTANHLFYSIGIGVSFGKKAEAAAPAQ